MHPAPQATNHKSLVISLQEIHHHNTYVNPQQPIQPRTGVVGSEAAVDGTVPTQFPTRIVPTKHSKASKRAKVLVGIAVFAAIAAKVTSAYNPQSPSQSAFDAPARPLQNQEPVASVVLLRVALNVANRKSKRSILSVLDQLVDAADVDSTMGLQQLTADIALAISRNKSSIASAYAQTDEYVDMEDAYRSYDKLSVVERSKFDSESRTKYTSEGYALDADTRSKSEPDPNAPNATMAVVTLILTITGDHSIKVPKDEMLSTADLDNLLAKIASEVRAPGCLEDVEILWTPTEPDETITKDEVTADYPDLNMLL